MSCVILFCWHNLSCAVHAARFFFRARSVRAGAASLCWGGQVLCPGATRCVHEMLPPHNCSAPHLLCKKRICAATHRAAAHAMS